MATISAILWDNRDSKSGVYPIKIRITETINKKTKLKYHLIDEYVSRDAWDKENERVKNSGPKKHPDAPRINQKIYDKLNEFEKNKENGEQIGLGDRTSFFWWCDEYLKTVEKKQSKRYWQKEKNACNQLRSFVGFIKVKQFDLKMLKDFEAHLLNSGKDVNTIYDLFTRIKRPIKLMVAGGAMEYHKNPFNGIRFKTKSTDRRRLTSEQIEILKNVTLTGAMERARDWYLISFYTGARFGDVCRWRASNFQNGRLIYITSKTGYKQNIMLPSESLQLLEKYNYKYPSGVQLINEMTETLSLNSVIDIKMKKDIINVQIDVAGNLHREALKRALKKAGLPEVTPHSTRHSLADYMTEKELTLQQMQGLLTHNNPNTTARYMSTINERATNAGSAKLWG